MTRTTTVIRRAVFSSGGMPNSGINAVLASALSHATTRDHQVTEGQPAEQPADLRVGQPRGPLVGGAAEWDAGRELRDHQRHRVCPTPTIGQSQIPTGPPFCSTSS